LSTTDWSRRFEAQRLDHCSDVYHRINLPQALKACSCMAISYTYDAFHNPSNFNLSPLCFWTSSENSKPLRTAVRTMPSPPLKRVPQWRLLPCPLQHLLRRLLLLLPRLNPPPPIPRRLQATAYWDATSKSKVPSVSRTTFALRGESMATSAPTAR
jgi:hypothetical protein